MWPSGRLRRRQRWWDDPFWELVATATRLQAPGGCPWDRAQTVSSLLPHLIEETWEAFCAARKRSRRALREELGDVLEPVPQPRASRVASASGPDARNDDEGVLEAVRRGGVTMQMARCRRNPGGWATGLGRSTAPRGVARRSRTRLRVRRAPRALRGLRLGPARPREVEGRALYTVVFLTLLAQREGWFTLQDVLRHTRAKMIRRHPHVFGDARAQTPQEAYAHWQAAKRRERRRGSANVLRPLLLAMWDALLQQAHAPRAFAEALTRLKQPVRTRQ